MLQITYFFNLASVFFVISPVSFCLQDASLTQYRFPSKALCDQT